MVKELREKSGAPMMDCKKALTAENGDINKSMDWLRAKGIARASSNADRVTMEGVIAVSKSNKGFVTMVEVNSETDFVSRNKDFQEFVAVVSSTISESGSTCTEGDVDISKLMTLKPVCAPGLQEVSRFAEHNSLQDSLGEIISAIRENIVIKRAENVYPSATNSGASVVSSYVHGRVGSEWLPPNVQMGKSAGVVSLKTETGGPEMTTELDEQIGRQLAMHVVAAQPAFLDPSQVPADVLAREADIFREQTLANERTSKKPKPADIVEKVVQGKVNKRLSELCLTSQAHMAVEGGPVIQKYLSSAPLTNAGSISLSAFQRWTLGG